MARRTATPPLPWTRTAKAHTPTLCKPRFPLRKVRVERSIPGAGPHAARIRLAKWPSFDDALALADGDQLTGGKIRVGLGCSCGPVNLHAGFGCVSQAEMQAWIVG